MFLCGFITTISDLKHLKAQIFAKKLRVEWQQNAKAIIESSNFRKYMDKKDLFHKVLIDARQAFGDDVAIAEDLQEFEI